MTMTEVYFSDRLLGASLSEARDSDSQLFGDLYSTLTPEVMKQGVAVDFGSDKAAFEATLAALELDDKLQDPHQVAHLQSASLVHPGLQSYVGKALPMLRHLPIIETLDAVQANGWYILKKYGMYPMIQVDDEEITSKLVIANTVRNEAGETMADTSKPGVVVGVTYRYLPEFDFEDCPETPLADLLHEGYFASRAGVVEDVAREMAIMGEQLAMPSRKYFMHIGSFVGGLLERTMHDVHVHYLQHYEVEAGRVRLAPEVVQLLADEV